MAYKYHISNHSLRREIYQNTFEMKFLVVVLLCIVPQVSIHLLPQQFCRFISSTLPFRSTVTTALL